MKAIITGMRGTVAPALAERLAQSGHETVAWDRTVVPTDNYDVIRDFIVRTKPDWFFHVATGSLEWMEMAARVCAEENIKFLYTSSVSVFAGSQQGPFDLKTEPKPDDDYGRYKLDGERRAKAANPKSISARLGWQIGSKPGSNNMIDYLTKTNREKGKIEASRAWYPSCAFLQDTSDALLHLIEKYSAGLYQLEGNPGLSFFEITTSLNRLHGDQWKIVATSEPARNNRMLDDRIKLSPISKRFHD